MELNGWKRYKIKPFKIYDMALPPKDEILTNAQEKNKKINNHRMQTKNKI